MLGDRGALTERCSPHCGTAVPGWPLGLGVHCAACHARPPGAPACARPDLRADDGRPRATPKG